jgi:hypothetical protein
MANRILRDTFLTSETLDSLSDGAERLYWRLISIADDFGRFEADARIILSRCYPLNVRHINSDDVATTLAELQEAGCDGYS